MVPHYIVKNPLAIKTHFLRCGNDHIEFKAHACDEHAYQCSQQPWTTYNTV